MRRDDWIDDSEYPDEDDIAAFGEDSPPDNDPLTIGYIGDRRPPFWTPAKIGIVVIVVLMLTFLLLPQVVQLFY
jgi:hypothetical protein